MLAKLDTCVVFTVWSFKSWILIRFLLLWNWRFIVVWANWIFLLTQVTLVIDRELLLWFWSLLFIDYIVTFLRGFAIKSLIKLIGCLSRKLISLKVSVKDWWHRFPCFANCIIVFRLIVKFFNVVWTFACLRIASLLIILDNSL